MSDEAKTIPEVITDLRALVTDYAKQETVEPLKGLGRYVAFGVAGSFLLSIAMVELALAGLRALQTETDTSFTGNLSWIPYVIVLVGLLIVIALLLWRINARRSRSA